jgi:cellulose synthase/poly-beta-1,6-N-acetylglucosamine synthase-like glycosyltransferase
VTLAAIARCKRNLETSIQERIAVVVIFDGVENISESILNYLDSFLEQEDQHINDYNNVLRRLKYSICPKTARDPLTRRPKDGWVWPLHISKSFAHLLETVYEDRSDTRVDPVKFPLFIVAKHFNDGKFASHRWFVEGICGYLHPTYCMFLDCGVDLEPNALSELIAPMEDQSVLGATGCLAPLKSSILGIENAQVFANEIIGLVDRRFEGACGFIPTLPSEFSAYRWTALHALQPYKEVGRQTLDEEVRKMQAERLIPVDLLSSNRDARFAYVTKASARYRAKDLTEMLLQRERWIAGAAIASIGPLLSKCFSVSTRAFLPILFDSCGTVLRWCSVAIYFWLLRTLSAMYFGAEDPQASWRPIEMWHSVVTFSLLVTAMLSFTYKAREKPRDFRLLTIVFGLTNIVVSCLLARFIIEYMIAHLWTPPSFHSILVWLGVLAMILRFILIVINRSTYTFFFTLPLFIYYGGFYVNLAPIYSVCNYDDLSSETSMLPPGTSVIEATKKRKAREGVNRMVKFRVFMLYALTNLLLIIALHALSRLDTPRTVLGLLFGYITVVPMCFKSLTAVISSIIRCQRQVQPVRPINPTDVYEASEAVGASLVILQASQIQVSPDVSRQAADAEEVPKDIEFYAVPAVPDDSQTVPSHNVQDDAA